MSQSRRTGPVLALMAASGLGLTACGTTRAYEGPELARDQVAVIQPAGAFDSAARILWVDDTVLGAFDLSVEVVPGRHVVTLGIDVSMGGAAPVTLQGNVELDARAGTVYEAHARTTGFVPVQPWFWIVDTSTHTIVAGKPPPD